MKTGNRIKPEGDSGKKKNSAVPNPNPNPNREIVQNPNQRNRKGKEGEEGGSAHLAVEHAGARGKEGRTPGVLLAGLRPHECRGQAARWWRAHPLGSAHAGEGAGDGAGALCSTVSPARRSVAATLR